MKLRPKAPEIKEKKKDQKSSFRYYGNSFWASGNGKFKIVQYFRTLVMGQQPFPGKGQLAPPTNFGGKIIG